MVVWLSVLPVCVPRSPDNNSGIQRLVSTEADSNLEASEILSYTKVGENPWPEEKDLHQSSFGGKVRQNSIRVRLERQRPDQTR